MLALSVVSRRVRADAEVVVTGTRTPEQTQRATIKTDVVTRSEAERRGATNVAEALSSQPGVQVNPGAYGYLGSVSPIQIQGFDLGRVLILEDGEPVIGDVGGAIDLSAIPLNDVERIEIVTGPSSALYGSSAIGGVVNVISAPPAAEGASGRARAEYRSHRGVVLQGSAAYRARRNWLELDASRTRQDAIFEAPNLPDTHLPETKRSFVGLRAGTQLGAKIDLTVRGRWLRQRFAGVESQEYPGLGRYATDQPQTADRFALHLMETIRLSRRTSLRFSLARQWVNRDSETVPRGSPLGQLRSSSQTMQSFEATATVADGPRTWVVGSRFEAQRLSQTSSERVRVNGELVTRDSSEVDPQALNAASLYGQLAWKLGRVLTVLPGARGEYHGRYGSVLAPRLALAARPSDSLTLRVGFGRGFRTPNAEELGFDFDHSVYGYRVVGNPALEPERSWGLNADASYRAAPFLTLRTGGFANWVDNLIDIDLASGVRNGTVFTYSYRNFARVRTLGGNVGLSLVDAQRFRGDLSYDYLWARDVASDRPLTGRPAHTLTASARLALPFELELYTRLRVVSDAYVDGMNLSPGYQTFDVRVSRAVWSGVRAYTGVLNLLDSHQDPGRLGDLRPPLGRVLYVGLSATFPGVDES